MEATNNINLVYSEILRRTLHLRTEPIAVKLIETDAEMSPDVIRPYRDRGIHMAMCQAFSLVRRENLSIFCDKSSEWCWAPLVGFGLCESEEGTEAFDILSSVGGNKELSRKFMKNFPRMPLGKYIGVLLMPLCDCTFEPDVTLVYCDDKSQLRGTALAVKNITGNLISTQFDAIDSCVYACIPTIQSGEYRVTIPDIGEHERALASESEMILSVPSGKLEELTEALAAMDRSGIGYRNWKRGLDYDFKRPPFYEDAFRVWGL